MSKQRGVELLRDLGDRIAHILHERAADIAVAVTNHMRTIWGGQLLYFPKGQALDIEQRDKEMWHDFNDTNHQALAEKYHLAVPVVYKRLRLVRDAIHTANQPDLFGP